MQADTNQRKDEIAHFVVDAVDARKALEDVIDREINRLSIAGLGVNDSDTQVMLQQLMSAVNNGNLSELLGNTDKKRVGFADIESENEDDEDLDEVKEKVGVTENTSKTIEAVMNDENLTTAQKEVILDSNQADIKMMNAILEMETRLKEEALKNVENNTFDNLDIDDAINVDDTYMSEPFGTNTSIGDIMDDGTKKCVYFARSSVLGKLLSLESKVAFGTLYYRYNNQRLLYLINLSKVPKAEESKQKHELIEKLKLLVTKFENDLKLQSHDFLKKLSAIPSPDSFTSNDTDAFETLEQAKANLHVLVKNAMESLSTNQTELQSLIEISFTLNKEMLDSLSNARRDNRSLYASDLFNQQMKEVSVNANKSLDEVYQQTLSEYSMITKQVSKEIQMTIDNCHVWNSSMELQVDHSGDSGESSTLIDQINERVIFSIETERDLTYQFNHAFHLLTTECAQTMVMFQNDIDGVTDKVQLRTTLRKFYDELQLELENKTKQITIDYEYKTQAEVKRQFSVPGVTSDTFSLSHAKCNAELANHDRQMQFYKTIFSAYADVLSTVSTSRNNLKEKFTSGDFASDENLIELSRMESKLTSIEHKLTSEYYSIMSQASAMFSQISQVIEGTVMQSHLLSTHTQLACYTDIFYRMESFNMEFLQTKHKLIKNNLISREADLYRLVCLRQDSNTDDLIKEADRKLEKSINALIDTFNSKVLHYKKSKVELLQKKQVIIKQYIVSSVKLFENHVVSEENAMRDITNQAEIEQSLQIWWFEKNVYFNQVFGVLKSALIELIHIDHDSFKSTESEQIEAEIVELIDSSIDQFMTHGMTSLSRTQEQRRKDVSAAEANNKRDLVGLSQEQEQSMKLQKDFIRLKYGLRSKFREKSLIDLNDILETPENLEKLEQQELMLLEARMQQDHDSLVADLQTKLDKDIDRLSDDYTKSLDMLQSSDPSEMLNQLLQVQKERRLNKETELINEGMSADDSKIAASKFYEQVEKEEIESLNESIQQRKIDMAAMLDALKADQITRVEKVFEGLIASQQGIDNDISGMQTKRQKYVDMISLRIAVALALVNNGFGKCQEISLQLINDALDSSTVTSLSDSDLSSIREMVVVTADLSKDMPTASDKERTRRKKLDDLLDLAMTSIRHCLEERLESESIASKYEFETKLHGFQTAFGNKSKALVEALISRLEIRRNIRENELILYDESYDDAVGQANREYNEHIEDDSKELNNKLQEELSFLSTHMLSKFEKAKLIRQNNEGKISQLEDEELKSFSQQVKDLESALLASIKEHIEKATEASLESKLALDKELLELHHKQQKELDELRHELENRRMLKEKEIQNQMNEKRQQLVESLEKEGASKTVIDQQVNELREEHTKLQEALKAQEIELVESKLKENAQASETLMAAKFEEVSKQTMEAAAAKQDALLKLDRMRQEHEDELKKLVDGMLHQRSTQEKALRDRLEAKREAQKQKLQLENATNEVTLIEEARLDEEEQASLLELNLQLSDEENQKKELLIKQHAIDLELLIRNLEAAEIDSVIAASKEMSVATTKDMKLKLAMEIQNQEIQKIINQHEEQLKKFENEKELERKNTKSKLLMRRQNRKETKEKEHNEKQHIHQRQLQQFEADTSESSEWMKLLQVTIERAQNQEGLSDLEKEDFCFQEILGKKLVPEKYYSEAISRIQNGRHSKEMSVLLSSHFEERITELKSAVQQLIEQKLHDRIELVQSLSNESDEVIKQKVAELDGFYNEKQKSIEKDVIKELEPKHLVEQLDLRQRQFSESAKVLSFYMNPEAIENLKNSSDGKSALEQMEEYKQKLEREKQTRLERFEKERAETESKLQQEHEAEMEKMKNTLEEEKKKVDEEYNRKRQEFMKQREEIDKKSNVEESELQDLEKKRILETFEKEKKAAEEALENERLAQKSKLQTRLNRRRTTRASTISSTDSSAVSNFVTNIRPMNETTAASIDNDKQVWDNTSSATTPKAESGVAFTKQSLPAASTKLIEAKLERIEKIIIALEKSQSQSNATTVEAAKTAAVSSLAAIDTGEPTPGSTTEIANNDELHVQERSRLDYGLRLANLIGLKKLTIKIARLLPLSNLVNNSFAQSYVYDKQSDVLTVHQKRLASSGDFGLVIIHALSHIKVRFCISIT